MNDYTASNGTHLMDLGKDTMRLSPRESAPVMTLGAPCIVALREFFQAEEDERLGRWRWPEEPDYVVYPAANGCLVLLELTGDTFFLHRDFLDGEDEPTTAARAYFEAHPQPKPWHDAKPGELWVIRLADQEEIGVSVEAFEPGADVFQVPDGESISVTRPSIVAGRRVWPEVKS